MDGSHKKQSRKRHRRWKQPVETATFYNSQNNITDLEGRKSNRNKQQDKRQIISDVYTPGYNNFQNNRNYSLHNTRNKTIAKNELKKSNKTIIHNINVDKASLKIHGLEFEGSSADSDSGKSDFDEEYYKYQPQPIHIDKNLIVTVNQNDILPNPRLTRISKKIQNNRYSDWRNTKNMQIERFPNENGISNVPTHSQKASLSRDELLMAPKYFRTTKDEKDNYIFPKFTFDTTSISSENKTHKTSFCPEKSPTDKPGAQKIQARPTNNIKQPTFLDKPCYSNSKSDELIFERNNLNWYEPNFSSGYETGASNIQTWPRNVNVQPTFSYETNFFQPASNELITTGPCTLIDTLVNKLQTSSKIGPRNFSKPPNDIFSDREITVDRQTEILPNRNSVGNVIPSSSNSNKSDDKQTVQAYGTVHGNNTADLHIQSDAGRNSSVNTNQSNDINLLPVDKDSIWMRIFDWCLCCFSN